MSSAEAGVFTSGQLDQLVSFFEVNGHATLRGVFGEAMLAEVEDELAGAQRLLVEGSLDARHGTVILDEPDATIDGRPFAHYVCFATTASHKADRLVHHPALVEVAGRLLGPNAWLLDDEQFGVVYQDARPDPGSGYSRIGWHTDHQSGPHLDIWPGVAFTVHFDPTSPANGFLRVLPGSHLGGTEGIPAGFERVPGEIALYRERGDVLFHHADLWHGAARGTADGPAAVRRHLRGSWHGGSKLEPGHGTEDFVKNALR
ncbi:MAG: phytanoyl-CoA dioxygenase family protein [Acidimicrobiales bacterium]|jgi:ectoine hydroxylase-related dioxygenase (phytanoyl-CoA dioxygenase family)